MTTPSTKIAESMLDAMAGNGGELPVPEVDFDTPYSVKAGPDGEKMNFTGFAIRDRIGFAIAVAIEGHAQFIVDACNSHQALVDAVIEAEIVLRREGFNTTADFCSAALALAGETK